MALFSNLEFKMSSLYSSRAGPTYPSHVQAGAGPAKPDADAEAANQRQVAEYIVSSGGKIPELLEVADIASSGTTLLQAAEAPAPVESASAAPTGRRCASR